MTDWTDIDPIISFAIKAPITFEYGRAWYNNPIAIAEGAPGAPRVAIDVDGQTALATDETDESRVLRPDGAGGVWWGPESQINSPRAWYTGVEAEDAILPGYLTDGTNRGTHGITRDSEGRFVVPDEGVYLVKYNASGGGRYTELRHNGVAVPGADNGATISDFVPVHCNAGDTLGMWTTVSSGQFKTGNIWIVKV